MSAIERYRAQFPSPDRTSWSFVLRDRLRWLAMLLKYAHGYPLERVIWWVSADHETPRLEEVIN